MHIGKLSYYPAFPLEITTLENNLHIMMLFILSPWLVLASYEHVLSSHSLYSIFGKSHTDDKMENKTPAGSVNLLDDTLLESPSSISGGKMSQSLPHR